MREIDRKMSTIDTNRRVKGRLSVREREREREERERERERNGRDLDKRR